VSIRAHFDRSVVGPEVGAWEPIAPLVALDPDGIMNPGKILL
jgi:FAD/FMN-containing dehydrogenase